MTYRTGVGTSGGGMTLAPWAGQTSGGSTYKPYFSLPETRKVGTSWSKAYTTGQAEVARINRENAARMAGGTVGATSGYAAGTPSAQTRLAEEIYKQNQAAAGREQEQYAKGESSVEEAYKKGLMSNEEYQRRQSEQVETTRAQYGHLGREFAESRYGQVNIGAVRAGAQDIKRQEAEAIIGGERALRSEQAGRETSAAGTRAQSYLDLYRAREIPAYDIPKEFGPEAALTAMRGPEPAPTSRGPITSRSEWARLYGDNAWGEFDRQLGGLPYTM